MGVFALFAQVEVVARVQGNVHRIPGALAHRQVGQPGRDHDGFLRAADQDVDIPVDLEVCGPEPGDRVDHQQGVAALLAKQLRHGRHAVAYAGRGFRRLHQHGAVLDAQGLAHLLDRERFPVGCRDHIHVAGVRARQRRPALPEFAGRKHQHAVAGRGDVADRGLHGAGARAGEQQHIVRSADKDLEVSKHLRKQAAKLGRAVVHIGRGHGELRRGQQRRGAGGKQACLADHAGHSRPRPPPARSSTMSVSGKGHSDER